MTSSSQLGVMTSSEPATTPVLAQGYLHPGILFLRLAVAVRGTIIPIIVGVFFLEDIYSIGIISVALFFMVTNMVYSLIRFVTFRYWLTTEELVTTEGIFNRQERRIPVDRVQDLSFEQTLVRRFFGLVVVTVETASGEGAEAKLDSLGLRPAAQLREAMQYIRTQRSPASAAAGVQLADVPDEEVLFRVRAKDLTLRGLTDNRAGAILIALFVVADQADQFGAFEWVERLFSWAYESISNMETAVAVAVIGLALIMVVLLGWVVSVAASFLLFHGFVLVRRGEVFQRRYGLLTTRVRSLPQTKIQRVLMEQSWLRRLLSLVVVRADSAGSGANQSAEVKTGLDVVAPMTRLETGRRLVPLLLPGMDAHRLSWLRVSGKVINRLFAEGVVVAAVALAVGLPLFGPLSWLALLIPVLALVSGVLIYNNLGYSHVEGHFTMRWGVIGRYRAYIPLRKVQAVALRAGPWDRMFGLARLVVYVAGSSPTMLAHLTRSDAQRLQRELVLAAASTKFVW